MALINIENLNFAYSKNELVLQNLNLHVPQGSIFGFLGVNGAGKTTTLRILLGLLKSQSGTIEVFNKNIMSSYPQDLKNIGSLIENPSLYSHLSGQDNLRIWSKYFAADQNRINEVLDLVNLSEHKHKLTGKYSTGMKQRLGLGIALLHNPELVILDEPTNGLDPMGIIELRSVIHRLKEEGKTILLSSHILSEVEKIVTHLGIIHNGQITFQGSLSDLHDLKRKNIKLKIRTSNLNSAAKIFEHMLTAIEANHFELQIPHENEIPEIINTLIKAQHDIYEITPVSQNLENIFLSITSS